MTGFRNRHRLADRDRGAAEAFDLAADGLAVRRGVTICLVVEGSGRVARRDGRAGRRCDEQPRQGDRQQPVHLSSCRAHGPNPRPASVPDNRKEVAADHGQWPAADCRNGLYPSRRSKRFGPLLGLVKKVARTAQ